MDKYEDPAAQAKATKLLDMNSAYLGVSRRLLMENAGRELARACDGASVAIFCGPGNNGGDGLAAARHISSAGKKVTVYAVSGERTTDAQKNYELAEIFPSIKLIPVSDSSECETIKKEVSSYDIIVDALLGVGAKGELREPVKSLVAVMNRAKAKKIAADIPTPGFKADKTISFHSAKTPDAFVANIGIPLEADTFCGPGDVYSAILERTGSEHKGDFGRLLVIGGSIDYIGAPILTAKAAYRTSIDLVTLACPRYVAERVSDPVLMIKPTSDVFHLKGADVDILLKLNYDSVVLGNGIGLHDETRSFVREFLRKTDKPVVLDADALKHIETRHIRTNHILTPHATEYINLFGELPADPDARSKHVGESAKKVAATILLKGPVDVISNGVRIKYNRTHNSGMTVGGTGDVLAGITGALAAKADPFTAACAAAFLSGLSGNFCRDEKGYSFTASDVLEKIPDAIKYCRGFE
ncbi:MAG: NAD(P)H-hydrate dehydratase [Candidatus Altiarchaeia archaeon]